MVSFKQCGPPLDEADLVALENRLHCTLPATYRRFLLQHNGGAPSPARFGAHMVAWFLAAGAANPLGWGYDLEMMATMRGAEGPSGGIGPPESLLPIAVVDDADLLLLSLTGPNAGAIYHWWRTHEGYDESTCRKVADSLEELLALLQ